jgi:hypothetical protein
MATTPLLAWMDATADLKASLYTEAYDGALAKIEETRKTKKTTETQRKQAAGIATSYVLRHLAKLAEYNGTPNPLATDPAFGPNATVTEAALANKAADVAEAAAKPELDDLATWLEGQDWSSFAISLARQYRSTGRLSEKQVKAAKSMRSKMETQKTDTRTGPATRNISPAIDPRKATDLDLSDLKSGYYAVPEGDTRLKVRIARPTQASKWHGWIFVSDGGEYGNRRNYGKQAPSGKYQGEISEALTAIMADPLAAQLAYGKLTGTCGSCGRKLEDETSVALGIGPVCRAKWDA